MWEDEIRKAADAFVSAKAIVAFIGSGFSAESGIKTFRGEDGHYSDRDIAELTHVSTFETGDRARMLAWYQGRRDQVWTVEPNPGHHALAQAARHRDVLIATQNVDGLINRAIDSAGSDPEVVHLHGSILEVACHDCGDRRRDDKLDLSTQPACGGCGGPVRPGVVWFGEALPEGAFERSIEAAARADLCLIVGTSGLVYPAAAIPEYAQRAGATLIEINPNTSALSRMCDIVIEAKSGEVLPAIVEAAFGA